MVDDLLEISRYDQDRSTFELVDLAGLVLAVSEHQTALVPGVLDGMSVADREHVFERFSRGSPADRAATDSGAGLGLALVAQHVRGHDGHAWVEERPGGGAPTTVSGTSSGKGPEPAG